MSFSVLIYHKIMLYFYCDKFCMILNQPLDLTYNLGVFCFLFSNFKNSLQLQCVARHQCVVLLFLLLLLQVMMRGCVKDIQSGFRIIMLTVVPLRIAISVGGWQYTGAQS